MTYPSFFGNNDESSLLSFIYNHYYPARNNTEIRKNYYEGPESFYQTSNFGDLSKFRNTTLHNVKVAYDAGVLIAGGTDDIYASLWPGEAMHREMHLLAMAGIPPLDVIKICTFNAAKVLRRDD